MAALLPPSEGAATTARGDSSFGGGSQCDSKNAVSCGSPAYSLRRSFASEGSRPSPRDGVALPPPEAQAFSEVVVKRLRVASPDGTELQLNLSWKLILPLQNDLRVYCAKRETLRLHVHKFVMNFC
jgi:hypothetical protein